MVHFGEFLKNWTCGQTVLPDRSVLIVQKLVENAKIKQSNATYLVIFKARKDSGGCSLRSQKKHKSKKKIRVVYEYNLYKYNF